MTEALRTAGVLGFDNFSLDLGRGCLHMDGTEVPLRPKTFALLSYLATNSGRLVSKDELIRAVWRGAVVSDDVLVQSVGELRRALGDKGAAIIRTVPRRGYRFEAGVVVAPVSRPLPHVDTPLPDRIAAEPESTSCPSPARRRHWPLYGAVFVLLAAVLSAGAWKLSGLPGNSGASERNVRVRWMKPVVAILPFETPGHAAGLQDSAIDPAGEIMTVLSHFSLLTVKPGAVEQLHRDGAAKPDAAARDPDTPYLVASSVRQTAGGMHVNVQLLDPGGTLLRQAEFEGHALKEKLRQFAVEVVYRVVQSEHAFAAARSPDDLDAYDIVQRAENDLRKLDPQDPHTGVVKARDEVLHAIDLDPDYAESWSLLAETYLATVMGGFSEFRQNDLQKAEAAARRALDRDRMNVRAHAVLAHVYLFTNRPELAQTEVDGLLKINPYSPQGLATRGNILLWLGDTDAAIQTLEAVGRTTTPLGVFNVGGQDNLALALAYYLKGRYRDAINNLGLPDPLSMTSESLSEILSAPLALAAAAYAQLEDKQRAGRAADLVRKLDPVFASRMAYYGGNLRIEADKAHLRDGLVKAGLL